MFLQMRIHALSHYMMTWFQFFVSMFLFPGYLFLRNVVWKTYNSQNQTFQLSLPMSPQAQKSYNSSLEGGFMPRCHRGCQPIVRL